MSSNDNAITDETSSSSSTIQSETKLWAYTKSDTFKLDFNWTIDNFSFYFEDDPETFDAIHSPKYTAPGHEDVRFNIDIYPNNESKENKDYLSLYFNCRSPNYPSPIYAKYKICLVDGEGKHRYSRYYISKFTERIGYGTPKMVARSVLLDPDNKLLPNDQLTIRCNATICFKRDDSSGISEMISNNTLRVNSRECKDELSSSMALLLANCEHSDVKLSVDGFDWPAHKSILSVRSPVFAAMFSHQDTKEAQEGKVEIDDVPKDTFKDLLEFIYTGTVPEKDRLTTELLAASDKYQVEGLKSACEIHLSTSLSVESAGSILLIADMHGAAKLKANAINFIAANIFKVMSTDAWINMAKVRPELMREVIPKMVAQREDESMDGDDHVSSEEEVA